MLIIIPPSDVRNVFLVLSSDKGIISIQALYKSIDLDVVIVSVSDT